MVTTIPFTIVGPKTEELAAKLASDQYVPWSGLGTVQGPIAAVVTGVTPELRGGSPILEMLLQLRAANTRYLIIDTNLDIIRQVRAIIQPHTLRMSFLSIKFRVGASEIKAELTKEEWEWVVPEILDRPLLSRIERSGFIGLKCHFLFDQCLNLIITPGLELIIYYGGGWGLPATIHEVINNEHYRNGEKGQLVIKSTIPLLQDQRVVLTNGPYTLGWAEVA